MKICLILFMWAPVLKWNNFVGVRESHCQKEELLTSKIEIITKTGSNEHKYDVENDKFETKYRFKNGVKCTEVKYSDRSVWVYDSTKDGESYPLEIAINDHTNNLKIKTKSRLYIYTYRNDRWDLIVDSEVDTKTKRDSRQEENNINHKTTKNDEKEKYINKLRYLGVKILTVDDYFNIRENDMSNFYIYQNGSMTTYKLNKKYIECEVKYKGETIWKDKLSRHGVSYAELIIINMDDEVVRFDFCFLGFPWFVRRRFNKYLGRCQEVVDLNDYEEGSKTNTTTFKLKMKGSNDNEPNSSAIDSDCATNKPMEDLNLKIDTRVTTYRHEFKSDEKCLEIEWRGMTIWKHDSVRDGESYPTEMYLDLGTTVLVKVRINRRSYIYLYKYENWEFAILYIDESTVGRRANEMGTSENENKSLILQSNIYP